MKDKDFQNLVLILVVAFLAYQLYTKYNECKNMNGKPNEKFVDYEGVPFKSSKGVTGMYNINDSSAGYITNNKEEYATNPM